MGAMTKDLDVRDLEIEPDVIEEIFRTGYRHLARGIADGHIVILVDPAKGDDHTEVIPVDATA